MSDADGSRVPLAREPARLREGAPVGLAGAAELPVHEASRSSADLRQRDLFPLPHFGAGASSPSTPSPPSRSVRRRLEKRSHVHGMVDEMTDALNELWGCPPAVRSQAPAGTPVPAAGHALVLSELRQAALRFGPCPEDLDGPGALEELRISQSYEGDATLVAPVSFDLVDSISLSPAGSPPTALGDIDEAAGLSIARRLKELVLLR